MLRHVSGRPSPFVLAGLLIAALLTTLTAGTTFGAGVGEAEFEDPEQRRLEETDELVIYSYGSLPGSLRDLIAEHFEREYGVEVELERIGETGAVYTQLYLERDEPIADAVIGFDESYLPRLREDRLLEPYEPENLQLARPELLVDEDFLVVPFDYGYITVNYDREHIENPPRSWEELLDPRLQDSFIMLHPGTSSPGRNFLLYTVAEFGEDGYLDFWREFRDNVLTVSGSWSEGYGLYIEEEAPMVVSYETSPAFHREFEDTDRYNALVFDNAAYLQVEVAGIVRGARNRRNAERLIDFIVSEEFQAEIPLTQIMYPIHPDVSLPDAFEAGPAVERSVQLDPDHVAENFDTWLEEWEEVMR